MSHPRIYFYCCPEPDNLQDDIIILAEGLRELGIPYYSSENYWLQSNEPGDYLFRKTEDVAPDDCDIVVLPYTWYNWITLKPPRTVRRKTPEGLFKQGRRYRTVYMDTNDGLRTVSWEPSFRQFDLILRTKFQRRGWSPSNLRPWVLGMSNRVLRMTEGAPAFASRQKRILVNFGASHPFPHGVRIRAQAAFDPRIAGVLPLDSTRDDLSQVPDDPYDRLMWEQTNHRHCRSYFERLKTSQAVSCFCGDLLPPMPWRDPGRLLLGGNKAKILRAFYGALSRVDPRQERVSGWDSFRFWEALCAGCATFNLDLDSYGALLPVMPQKGVHYFGVDLRKPKQVIEQVSDDPGCLERVAAAGRAWALAEYSPAAMARRFLGEVGSSASGTGA